MGQLVVGHAVEVGVHVNAEVREERLRHDPRPVHGDAKKQRGIRDAAQLRRIRRRTDRPQIPRRLFTDAVPARRTLVAELEHRHQRRAVRVGPSQRQHHRRDALQLPHSDAARLHPVLPRRTQQHVKRKMHRGRLAVKPDLPRRLVGDVPRPALDLRRRGGIEGQLHLGRVDRQRQLDRGLAVGRDDDRRLGRCERHPGVGQRVAHREGADPRLGAEVGQLDAALGQARLADFQQTER